MRGRPGLRTNETSAQTRAVTVIFVSPTPRLRRPLSHSAPSQLQPSHMITESFSRSARTSNIQEAHRLRLTRLMMFSYDASPPRVRRADALERHRNTNRVFVVARPRAASAIGGECEAPTHVVALKTTLQSCRYCAALRATAYAKSTFVPLSVTVAPPAVTGPLLSPTY